MPSDNGDEGRPKLSPEDELLNAIAHELNRLELWPRLKQLFLDRRIGLMNSLRIPVHEAGGDTQKYLLAGSFVQGQVREIEAWVETVENVRDSIKGARAS